MVIIIRIIEDGEIPSTSRGVQINDYVTRRDNRDTEVRGECGSNVCSRNSNVNNRR